MLMFISVFVFSCERDYFSVKEVSNSDQNKSSKVSVKFDKELLVTNLENKNMDKDIDIIKGIIYFKNQSAFDKYDNNISALKNEIKLLKSPQFEKKELQIKEIREAIENSKSIEETKNIIEKYSNFLEFSDSTIYFKNRNGFDYLFSDYNSNYFFVGNMIHLFEKEYNYVIIDGDLEKVKKIKDKNINIENVFSFKVPKVNNNKAKINAYTTDVDDFIAYRRQSNPYDSGKRGTVGIYINSYREPFGTNAQGIQVFKCRWYTFEQGYAERRTFGVWFTVNSNLVLNSNGYFGVTSPSIGNVAYGSYSNVISGYDNELNYSSNYIYPQNSNGGALFLTQNQINSLSYYVFNTSGYFQTGQVPNINIIW